MSFRRILPFAALVLLACVAAEAFACPTCKDAVAANSAGGNAQGAIAGGDAASGFNNAIYLSLGSIFSIVGLLGWRVWRAVQRADSASS
jgi:hypothetical protein